VVELFRGRLIGTIIDLLLLTFNPVDSEKECRTDFRKSCRLVSPSRIMRVSSAYWITGKSEVSLKGIGRLRRPLSLALLRSDYRRSAAKTNRRGKRVPLPDSFFYSGLLSLAHH